MSHPLFKYTLTVFFQLQKSPLCNFPFYCNTVDILMYINEKKKECVCQLVFCPYYIKLEMEIVALMKTLKFQ